MTSLSILPNELIAEIVSCLDQNSITSFCLTCSNFNKVGNSQLKKRIVVVPKTKNNVLLDSFEQLQSFTYGFTKVKEDRFTELYSRNFFKTTRELACLELYKRKKLQDYEVKLPYLENFFTFDHRSYRWYEDFIQYRLTPNVNLSNQYQTRTRQRSSLRPYNEPPDISSDEEIDEIDVGNIAWRAMIACNEESYDKEISASEEEGNKTIEQEQLSTRKLYTKMDENLEFLKFSKYGKFQKLQHLYLSDITSIEELGFELKLITALFLCRFDRVHLYRIIDAPNLELALFEDLSEADQILTSRMLCNPELYLHYDGSIMSSLPVKWKYLKELRFALDQPCMKFSSFGACFESLEILYVHDINGLESQESILDFILNMKGNTLRQIVIFAGGQFRKFQVRKYFKKRLKKILTRQKCLVKFTIRYGICNSIEAKDLINL